MIIDQEARKGRWLLGSVADPDSLCPDPAFQVNPDPEGFDDQKFKKIHLKILFYQKIAIYLSLGLHKGRPSYKRSLQPSNKTSSTSQNEIY
jgi:hypothetical protein